MKKVVGYVTQRRSGRERSRGVTKQKQTYMCFHLPVHTFLSFDIYIRIHLHIYTCNISICISISVYAICSRNTQRWRACRKKGGLRWNASPMNSSESPRKLVGDITMSALALEQIFQKIAELLEEESAKRRSCQSCSVHIKLSCCPSIFSIQGRKSWSYKRSCPWTEWQVKIFNSPWKLTYPLNIEGWKIWFPFQLVPFQKRFSGVISSPFCNHLRPEQECGIPCHSPYVWSPCFSWVE